MTLDITNEQGATALDPRQLLMFTDGTLVLTGLGVSIGSGTFGASDTVSVAAGSALVEASAVSPSQTDVSIPAATTYPRRDTIYVDSSGDVQRAAGTEAEVKPPGATRFDTYNPAPADLSGTTGVPIAEVWVDPDAASLGADDLRDRRVDGRLPNEAVEALQNLGDEVFSGYPLEHGTDTDAPTDAHHAQDHNHTEAALTKIPTGGLAFDPATQAELDAHAGTADAHHAQDHASRHHEGGADELDAADLSGASGSSGEVLQTDGTSTNWASVGGGSTEASETDGWTDITIYQNENNTSSSFTVLDISTNGTMLGGLASGPFSSSNIVSVDVTVDGTTNSIQGGRTVAATGERYSITPIPPTVFETSLKVVVQNPDSREAAGTVFVK